MENKETHMTENAKLYELGFHIIPSAGEEKAAEVFSVIKENIIKNNGEVVKTSEPKATELAYTIVEKIAGKNTRFNDSYFAWIKFVASVDDIDEIKTEIHSNEDVIRYIIVKTVEDDEHSTSRLVAEEEEGDEQEVKEDKEDKKQASKEEKVEDDSSNDSEKESDKSETKEEVVEKTEEEEVSEPKEEEKESKKDSEDEIDKAIDDLVEEK